MRKRLKKNIVVIWFVLCSLFNFAYASNYVFAGNLKEQTEKLNKEIKRAQQASDEKALNEALNKYNKLINENFELKNAIAKINQAGKQFMKYKNKADRYFSQGKYKLAIKEYQKVLFFSTNKYERQNFGNLRASVAIKIGESYLKLDRGVMANKAFKDALSEKISPANRKFIENRISLLKLKKSKIKKGDKKSIKR
jgi:tetratricopeptide (TPR) repeat protein